MTPTQFQALAKLLRLRKTTMIIPHRVLVLGQTVTEAAKAEGVSYTRAYNMVQRVKAGLALCQQVTSGHNANLIRLSNDLAGYAPKGLIFKHPGIVNIDEVTP